MVEISSFKFKERLATLERTQIVKVAARYGFYKVLSSTQHEGLGFRKDNLFIMYFPTNTAYLYRFIGFADTPREWKEEYGSDLSITALVGTSNELVRFIDELVHF